MKSDDTRRDDIGGTIAYVIFATLIGVVATWIFRPDIPTWWMLIAMPALALLLRKGGGLFFAFMATEEDE